MMAARHLMLSTDLAAEAIAQRVGHTDPMYFNRRFRRYHGLSRAMTHSSACRRLDAAGVTHQREHHRRSVLPVLVVTNDMGAGRQQGGTTLAFPPDATNP
jgi:hypothetical protein